MNYNLAKELKDTGFPYKKSFIENNPSSLDTSGTYHVFYPTLEELIDACGDRFDSLKRMIGGWQAVHDGETSYYKGFGSTRKEAVAHLWLKLNKK